MVTKINVAIIGAGIAGEYLVKELKHPRYQKYNIIGFIDDDKKKIGTKVKEVQVLDSTYKIPNLVNEYNIDLFIIAMPSVSGQVIQRIVDKIKTTSKDFMIVPPIFQNLQINQIAYPRKVDINDLLRRPIQNVLTEESMKKLQNSTIMITGVAGSIGSEICVQLASCQPKCIIGIDFAETPLFTITNKIHNEYPNIEFIPILGNIQNRDKIKSIMKKYNPKILYHCAAFKHVGLMETNPHECINNNIMGSLNVIKEAIANKISRFVFVSTDKAVNAKGIMGASKRIIEKYILTLSSNRTKFMIVRFGNVLESNGSAIKILKEQIQKGGPVTITDLRMERYFMTITEASQLVIQASILGKGRELFVLDMGKPYKIIDIIHRLIELYGFDVNTIPIKVIGKRNGEKLSEELFHTFENPIHSDHKRILICNSNNMKDLRYFKNEVESLAMNHESLTNKEIVDKMFVLCDME
ncbi:MAG: polysaccharide biosynthesis protein [Candidatus Heimdallarchaeota archaeon]